MSERKRTIVQFITGFLGAIIVEIGVIAFQRHLLMGLSLGARMVLMIVDYWVIAAVPLLVMRFAGEDTTRHCYTPGGRHESVAEHSWRAVLMAYFLKDEFPEADMEKEEALLHRI